MGKSNYGRYSRVCEHLVSTDRYSQKTDIILNKILEIGPLLMDIIINSGL